MAAAWPETGTGQTGQATQTGDGDVGRASSVSGGGEEGERRGRRGAWGRATAVPRRLRREPEKGGSVGVCRPSRRRESYFFVGDEVTGGGKGDGAAQVIGEAMGAWARANEDVGRSCGRRWRPDRRRGRGGRAAADRSTAGAVSRAACGTDDGVGAGSGCRMTNGRCGREEDPTGRALGGRPEDADGGRRHGRRGGRWPSARGHASQAPERRRPSGGQTGGGRARRGEPASAPPPWSAARHRPPAAMEPAGGKCHKRRPWPSRPPGWVEAAAAANAPIAHHGPHRRRTAGQLGI